MRQLFGTRHEDLVEKFEWEEWEHFPYSPNVALCDFHTFGTIKEAIAKRRYHADEVQNEAQEWLSDIGREFVSKNSCYAMIHV